MFVVVPWAEMLMHTGSMPSALQRIFNRVIISNCLSFAFASRRSVNWKSRALDAQSVFPVFIRPKSRHSFTVDLIPISRSRSFRSRSRSTCPEMANGHGRKGDDTKDLLNYNDNNSKAEYERAVNELHHLMSNADAVAKASKNRAEKHRVIVPNMNRFIRRSGLSERDIDDMSIIHVSGTKGKGSTCAFVERILHAKGYKTGLFSSPHLVEVRERFRINGSSISRDMFVKHFWKVYSKLRQSEMSQDDMPAYFAFNVILSLHIFLASAVDVVIMEVGIGGEYDSTNFIRHPAVCGVTSLGLDHTSLLGNTLEEIAWNKAGIFKAGRPSVSAIQSPSCLEVLLNRAKEKKSVLHLVPELSQELMVRENLQLGIAGSKQVVNASLAVHLARIWEKSQHTECLPSNVENITSVDDLAVLKVSELTPSEIKGLSSCVWPGRTQTIKRPGITYYLDGAHTKESMEVCCEWFTKKSKEETLSVRGKVVRILLFNVTGDRNISILLTTLKRFCTFDAAVFSSNILSTVAAHNVADQAVKALTPSEMLRKAELNKARWDEIMATHSDDEEALINNNNNSDSLGSQNRVNPATRDCSSLDAASLKSILASQSNDEKHSEPPSKIRKYVIDSTGSTRLNSSADTVAVTSPSSADLTRRLSTEVTNADSLIETASVTSLPSSHSLFSDMSSESVKNKCREMPNNLNPLHGQDKVGEEIKTLSYSFPCVLHALVWANQNRDQLIKVKDLETSLPATPDFLRDADHIQILITGSLHLVGATLAILEPNMND